MYDMMVLVLNNAGELHCVELRVNQNLNFCMIEEMG